MPLRVKCRCGQEVNLRFNEWVHALFGLLLVVLLVNGTCLVLLVFRLGTLQSEIAAVQEREAKGAPAGLGPGSLTARGLRREARRRAP